MILFSIHQRNFRFKFYWERRNVQKSTHNFLINPMTIKSMDSAVFIVLKPLLLLQQWVWPQNLEPPSTHSAVKEKKGAIGSSNQNCLRHMNMFAANIGRLVKTKASGFSCSFGESSMNCQVFVKSKSWAIFSGSFGYWSGEYFKDFKWRAGAGHRPLPTKQLFCAQLVL